MIINSKSFLAILLLFVVSCYHERLDSYLHLYVEDQFDARTKVNIDGVSGNSTWSSGDEIAYCISNGSNNLYNIAVIDASASEFTPDIPAGYERAYYAIYPSSARGTNFSTPTVVYGSSYNLSGKNAETYSFAPMVGNNTGDDIYFYHVGGLLRFKFSGVDSSTTKIVVTFDGVENICGTYSVTSPGTTNALTHLSSGSGNVITFNNISVSGGIAWLNIPIPSGTQNISVVSIRFYRDNTLLTQISKFINWTIVNRASARQYFVDLTEASNPNSLKGVFSVSESKKVCFSKGNLQAVIGSEPVNYIVTASSWGLAANQYDIIGDADGGNSLAVGSYTDLFNFVGYNADSDYLYSYGLITARHYIGIDRNLWKGNGDPHSSDLFIDWGSIPEVISVIGTGWRTLTAYEWFYLLSLRPFALSKRGNATVSGVEGVVLFPDIWTLPEGCNFTPVYSRNYTTNVYDSSQWSLMEDAGAVFLPVTGYRDGTNYSAYYHDVQYGSSSGSISPMKFHIIPVNQESYDFIKYYQEDVTHAYPVRLVRDI